MTTIYILHGEEILLLYRIGSRVFKKPLWVGVGGHFEEYELNEPERCVLRELKEETGMTLCDIERPVLKYITMRRTQDEIRQQYIYFANLKNKDVVLAPCDEGELAWVKVEDCKSLPMSLTNGECLKHYFTLGRYDDNLYCGQVVMEGEEPILTFIPLKEYTAPYQ